MSVLCCGWNAVGGRKWVECCGWKEMRRGQRAHQPHQNELRCGEAGPLFGTAAASHLLDLRRCGGTTGWAMAGHGDHEPHAINGFASHATNGFASHATNGFASHAINEFFLACNAAGRATVGVAARCGSTHPHPPSDGEPWHATIPAPHATHTLHSAPLPVRHSTRPSPPSCRSTPIPSPPPFLPPSRAASCRPLRRRSSQRP